ncbi:GCN5-related N-acetyltransferase 10, chloroplastic [Euphorbia lathyris]|uniref:GCN5-related N-acetyltransferase 10, chloroplastic n=1 Tax=Euphorbia lathyris TaxID=212925 RepID=UPI0033132607
MAHIVPCISKGITVSSFYTCREIKLVQGAFRNTIHSHSQIKNKDSVLQCSTAASTSPSSAAAEQVEEDKHNLVTEFGWRVRRLANNDYEMREVAQLQAQAFHLPMPFFDDFFFQFFKAEVLAGLLYKLRNSPPDRYACLVADSSTSESKLVGVVDVTVLRDDDVLQHLKGAEEYLYISGIAVSQTLRRQKIGSVLLKACDVISGLWGYEYLVLRAYEEDIGARGLYTKAGYKVVSSDPQWMTWIGRKRRVLMIKQSNFHSLNL